MIGVTAALQAFLSCSGPCKHWSWKIPEVRVIQARQAGAGSSSSSNLKLCQCGARNQSLGKNPQADSMKLTNQLVIVILILFFLFQFPSIWNKRSIFCKYVFVSNLNFTIVFERFFTVKIWTFHAPAKKVTLLLTYVRLKTIDTVKNILRTILL